MKILAVLFVIVAFSVGILLALQDHDSADEAAIKEVIEKAYVQGIHINGDPEAIRQGFHSDFKMLVYKDDQITKVDLESWIARIVEGRKKNPGSGSSKTTHEFSSVEISGNAAVARVELYRNDKHVFTDFMSLYKFADGWKIVNKIFYRHP